ncbi:hypothetical protein Rhopal_000324-T1 [Rhodotorula paludigena]|uniref:Importin N-terminal domain-containing protein n=1 Tax=Rhodotorula paludigena TaxID=86838 RepID=A0AAV5GCI9_9BASI|nr:hypothetical protein Rhopal_000324-T1 [Rhodotorula paludigena]
MDAARLYHVFTASFESDPNTRIAAELELKKLEPVEGLLPTLLQLISPSSSSSPVVRLAAAIYLKNRIKSSWRAPLEPSPYASPASVAAASRSSTFVEIPPADRQSVKANLIPLYAALAGDAVDSAKVKEQVGEALSRVIECDFPEQWPTLVDEVKAMLAGDQGQVEAGLRATMEVFNSMRYMHKDESGTTVPHLVAHLLPLVLPLGQNVLASAPADSAALTAQGTLLRLVLKAYKNSIIHTLTPAHQSADSLIPWGSLLLQVVQHPLLATLLPDDPDAREKHPWAKSKKWACWALNKLFTRYGNPTQLPKNMVAQYGDFAARFVDQFAPEILKAYLAAVEKMVGGEWFPRKGKYHVLCFLEECINPKSMFALLKPHIPSLIEHFIFPLVCLTDDEMELFTDDPNEFARQFFGDFVADSYASPTGSALAFLAALTETRAKSTLLPLLQFIQSVVDKYPASTTPRQKDGALRMLGSLATTAVKSKKLAPMLESFFVQYIVPEFKSPHGLLRFRACDLVEKFESVDMTWASQDALENTLNHLMNCITDSDLPVRIQAAIALPELVRYERVRERMLPNLGRIMQELLKLASEVDLDALTNTTRTMVGEFSEEVVPFAVELAQSLIESYRRLLQETLETRDQDAGVGGGYDDEKTLVMMNVLKTIEQLVSSVREKKDLVAEIEKAVCPLLEATIRNSVVELFDETFEILDSLTFFQQSISPAMWACFAATYGVIKSDAPDYMHECFGFLDNCVNYGAEFLSTMTDYRRYVLEIFDMCMTSRALGAEDRVIACKLAEALLLRLHGQVDEAIPPVVERCMSFVLSTNDDDDFVVTKTLFMHSLELVILCVSYNPQQAIAILDRHDWTQQFFAQWFKALPSYSRVHDKKIILWAICALFDWLNGVGAGSPLSANVAQLLQGAIEVFRTYPDALAERKVAEANRDLEEEEVDDDMSDEDDLDLGEDDGDFEEADVRDRNTDFLDQLAQSEANRLARAGAFDDGDSAWSDEILWASPLDQFDSYQRFSGLLAGLQTANPTLYQQSLAGLSAEQQTILADVATKAAEGGDQVVAAQAYAALQASEGAE